MDLNEKIAARRREKAGGAPNLPSPLKKTHSSTLSGKKAAIARSEINHVYSAYLYQAAAEKLKQQLKESKNSAEIRRRLEKELGYVEWNVKLKQKAYPEDFSDTRKLSAANALLLSKEGEGDLNSLLKRIEHLHSKKSPKKKKSKPLIIRLIAYAMSYYILYLLIFDPDFSWWEFLIYFIILALFF